MLLTSYIRLVDKTVHEYELARRCLEAYASTPRNVISPLMYATGHMENCLNTLTRALNFADQIRRTRAGPILDRVTATRLRKFRDEIVELRHAIEHVEEMLVAGKLDDGAAVAIVLYEGQVELGGHTVQFADLAKGIEALHELAVEWSDFREPAAAP